MTDVLLKVEQVHSDKVLSENENMNELPIHLLIVVGQTFGKDEKKVVLERINSSLISIGDSLVSLKEDLNLAIQSQLIDSVRFDQENRIAYNNETSLQLEILINPTSKSVKRAFRDFLHSVCTNKHFINATLDFNSNGDFNLQDSLFSCDDLHTLLNEEVNKKLLLNTDNSLKFHLNPKLVELNKQWKSLEKQHKNIHLVNSQVTTLSSDNNQVYSEFLQGLDNCLNEKRIDTLMETGKLTGTLRINKPLLYIFPSRQGDSAYFTLNGYSILINGGYDRVKPCFWTFVNMLAQIDSILITHSDSDALGGLGSFFAKKLVDPDIKPNVLTVLGNLIASSDYKSSSSNDASNGHAQLAANLIANESAASSDATKSHSYVDLIIDSIDRLKIQLMPLVKNTDQLVKQNSTMNNSSKYEHINLYFKLGQGSLDLYVLSPFSNSTDYKDFVQQQLNHLAKHQTHQKSHLNPGELFKNIPMSHVTSAVVLLVWIPHVTKQTVLAGENKALRLLFPGNAPQHVIINALDKVKDFEILSCPIYKIKPAPEPAIHTIKKAPATNGTKPPTSATNGSTRTEKTLITGTKSSLTTKPPMPKVEKTNGASLASKTSQNGVSATAAKATNGTASTAKPKPAPKSAPVSAPKSAPVPAPKSAPVPAAKSTKPIEKKPVSSSASTKKTESTTTSNKANTSKVEAKANSTTNKTANTIRLSNVGAKSSTTTAAATKKPTATKSTSEEKPRTITKRDPKPSTAKPSTSKTNEVKKSTSKTTSSTSKSTESTKSVVETVTPIVVEAEVASVTEKVSEPSIVEDKIENLELESTQALNNEQVNESEQLNDEWPNLSPVKHDQNSQNENNMDGHYIEDRNNSIDVNNESGIDADTEGKERKEMNFLISDAKDLIQTPENEVDISFDKYQNGDVMTRSFIDNGEVNSNPFVDKAAAEEKRLKDAEDSLNDLNKTHELSDYDITSEKTEPLAEQAEPVAEQAEPEAKPVAEPVTEQAEPDVEVSEPVAEQAEPVVEQAEPVVEASEPVVEQSEPVYEKTETENLIEEQTEAHIDEPITPSPASVEEKPLIIDENVLVDTEESQEPVLENTENKQENVASQVSGLDSLLNCLNTMEIDSPNVELTNEITENGHEYTNGHAKGHANGHEDSELEDGEIVDDDEPRMEKIILKTGQEPISSGVTQAEDPSKWNLLELPKPVNPNELPVASSHDRKSFTPNGKKAPVSPSSDKSKLSSKSSNKNINPAYFEVSYIPAHGDPAYVDTDFFKKVRARHYILSTEEPTEKLLNSIIEAKETWEEKNLHVTIIPTYESDVIRKWFTNNEEVLDKLNIDITPAASMSTLTMDENPDLTCQLYKLEF